MAKHHAESGRTRNQRKKHDHANRTYEEKTGNPYHLSPTVRAIGIGLIVVVIVSITLLFASGLIRW